MKNVYSFFDSDVVHKMKKESKCVQRGFAAKKYKFHPMH
jgi:hypothetical protein